MKHSNLLDPFVGCKENEELLIWHQKPTQWWYTARGSTHVSSGLVRKYYIRLERLARDKHSSFIALVSSDEEKKRYNIGHRYQSH